MDWSVGFALFLLCCQNIDFFFSKQCTMTQAPLKMGNKGICQNDYPSPIFEDNNCFRYVRYLGNNIYSVSLSFKYLSSTKIFTRISCNSDRLAEGCEKSEGTSWTDSLINSANIFDGGIEKKYLGNICTQKGCSHKKLFSTFFLHR